MPAPVQIRRRERPNFLRLNLGIEKMSDSYFVAARTPRCSEADRGKGRKTCEHALGVSSSATQRP
jgi:hypothetical protein